jgi:hypothetical protein
MPEIERFLVCIPHWGITYHGLYGYFADDIVICLARQHCSASSRGINQPGFNPSTCRVEVLKYRVPLSVAQQPQKSAAGQHTTLAKLETIAAREAATIQLVQQPLGVQDMGQEF